MTLFDPAIALKAFKKFVDGRNEYNEYKWDIIVKLKYAAKDHDWDHIFQCVEEYSSKYSE